MKKMKLINCLFLSVIFFLNGCEIDHGKKKKIGEGDSEIKRNNLELGFLNPPHSAGVRCYWWWLNGNVTAEAITRDLEEMKDKGFNGALIFDADGSSQSGNRQVPAGPLFASPEWTKLFVHACKEAKRLNLELSLNIQSGWNLGGPGVAAPLDRDRGQRLHRSGIRRCLHRPGL